ncbi:protein-tyrosine phosphatase-like protein [Phellopilus nigrolimitatus]|nr:protein-tyrosine phosphatase-like protein [Phellopilus nigrolimitatus]
MSRQKKSLPSAFAEGSSREVTADANLVYGDFLYVGHLTAAQNTTFLQQKGITDVVSVGTNPGNLPSDVEGKHIGLLDSTSVTQEEFDKDCDEAGGIIDSVKKHNEETGKSRKKRKVLVHCSSGISRSPTIVVAYLMKYQGYSLLQALAQIWRCRPKVVPNAGFIKHLRDVETRTLGRNPSLTIDELPRSSKDRAKLLQNVSLPK